MRSHIKYYSILDMSTSQIHINLFIPQVLDYRLSRNDISNLFSSLTNEAGVLYIFLCNTGIKGPKLNTR
jgi:hypothetical protein